MEGRDYILFREKAAPVELGRIIHSARIVASSCERSGQSIHAHNVAKATIEQRFRPLQDAEHLSNAIQDACDRG
jgi:hypothetical protein